MTVLPFITKCYVSYVWPAVNDETFNGNTFYVMLCYVMLCYVMLCYVMLCYVIKAVCKTPRVAKEVDKIAF